jgi:hypothetical protein
MDTEGEKGLVECPKTVLGYRRPLSKPTEGDTPAVPSPIVPTMGSIDISDEEPLIDKID